MTTDELEQLLAQQPVGLLHRLARGRIHRHFRAGKRRIIELLGGEGYDTAKIRKVFHQLLTVGKDVVSILWRDKAVAR